MMPASSVCSRTPTIFVSMAGCAGVAAATPPEAIAFKNKHYLERINKVLYTYIPALLLKSENRQVNCNLNEKAGDGALQPSRANKTHAFSPRAATSPWDSADNGYQMVVKRTECTCTGARHLVREPTVPMWGVLPVKGMIFRPPPAPRLS